MHTSFTGNSRRPRQVNLSGRNTNPWANLPGAKSSSAQPSSHNAVAQAQADRARRAHERDRLNAAKKVQRVWRGHRVREQQKQKWRQAWDGNEEHLPSYIKSQSPQLIQPHQDEERLRSQTRLLVSFVNTHNDLDRQRLCYWGHVLKASWALTEEPNHALKWNEYFTKLSRIISHAIARAQGSPQRLSLLQMGTLILEKPVRLDYELQFGNLKTCLDADASAGIAEAVSHYMQALLLRRDGVAYDALVRCVFSTSAVERFPAMDSYIAIPRNQAMYCASVRRQAALLATDGQLWVLANTIQLWRSLKHGDKLIDWISAISDVLTKCANEVAARIDIVDQPMAGTNGFDKHLPLAQTIRSSIGTLAREDTVQDVMRTFQAHTSSVAEVAKPLANYAVALLRAFPTKATSIRSWLYTNSPARSKDGSTTTILYLWKASQATHVFRSIAADQNTVITTLTEAKAPSNQLDYQPASPSEILAWQEEWRIVLLFLELYTFILTLTDDEEFFALDDRSTFGRRGSAQVKQGTLPLSDVASLGSFLKHLAFGLYWHAADLAEYNESEDNNISVLFGQNQPTHTETKSAAKTLTGNDVSQMYMKGLATGLLRMIYERDSRRKFLPENYWLMTKHFDMQGFIPAVVAEEERRHEAIGDEDDAEDIDIDDEYEDEASESHMPNIRSLFDIRDPHTPRSQTSRQAERLAKQRVLASKRRQLQSLAPRLELLRNLPFFIPFDTRVQIFRRFVYRDQERRRNGNVDPDDWRMSVAASQARDLFGGPTRVDALSRRRAEIHRGSVFEDAFENFYDLGEELKEPIQISFIDQFNQPEAGIDGGGVTKEFLMSVTSEALDPHAEMALFEENEQRYIYPKPTILQQVRHMLIEDGNRPGSEGYNLAMRTILRQYEFLGRIIGKCMYEGILIDVNFAGFFLLKWALTGGTTMASNETAFRASINDLRDFDDQLYQGLLKLKNYPGDVESDFGLNFTVSDSFEIEGRNINVTTDLIAHGAKQAVTNENRKRYIERIVRYRLQEQPRLITDAFLKGLGQIISPMWLAMFNQKELQKLVGGDNQELDIDDLRRHTLYGGLYVIGDDGKEHPVIGMFWKVLKEMSDENRRKVLKFVTSTPRAPLLGFSHLNPRFSIRDSSEDQTRLPSTSTCVNLLKLPRYADERTMREKLLYAANAGAGFDLS